MTNLNYNAMPLEIAFQLTRCQLASAEMNRKLNTFMQNILDNGGTVFFTDEHNNHFVPKGKVFVNYIAPTETEE